ncbi:MAG: class I SAM-dependent methyltransferase [Acidimicrobiales bacterium]
MSAIEVASRLARGSPSFHGRGTVSWNAMPGTLGLIARFTQSGQRSTETGCGASTVVFAAAGTHHTAISPFPDEHERIRSYCRDEGIDISRVTFIEGSSDDVLPGLETPVDFAFIDGAHSFPYPAIDWHYLARRLAVGGFMLLDDVPIPAVGMTFRHMQGSEAWSFEEFADDRAAMFRRVKDDPTGDYWQLQRMNRAYPQYGFLPLHARIPLEARARAVRLKRQVEARSPVMRRLIRSIRPGGAGR